MTIDAPSEGTVGVGDDVLGHGGHLYDARHLRARTWIARAFTIVEDVVYLGLGVLLAGSALVLLVTRGAQFARGLWAGTPRTLDLLDSSLLILLIVELLYTVQVSFREHTLVPGPFLLVGLISAIRRVLILTAEFGEVPDKTELGTRYFILELAVLTLLIVSLVFSYYLLHKTGRPAVSTQA